MEFSVTVIDVGDGPEACLGDVLDSFPPQCGGPVVEGLEFGPWAQTVEGVAWGDRTLAVTWPPVNERVRLVEERPYGFDPPPRPDIELPADCRDIEVFVEPQVLARWASANTDRAGISMVTDAGLGVLQVKGDLDAVRRELATNGAEPCLVEVAYSRGEIEAAQDAVGSLFSSDVFLLSSGSGNAYNRLTIDIAVADQATTRRILEVIDDPGIVRITGEATILDGI